MNYALLTLTITTMITFSSAVQSAHANEGNLIEKLKSWIDMNNSDHENKSDSKSKYICNIKQSQNNS